MHRHEARPPGGVAERPAQLALGLDVGGPTGLGGPHHSVLAGEETDDARGNVPRRGASRSVSRAGTDEVENLKGLADDCLTTTTIVARGYADTRIEDGFAIRRASLPGG